MDRYLKGYVNIIIIITVLFLSNELRAISFPFRTVKVGDPVPEMMLKSLDGKKTLTLKDFEGKGFVMVFWGADLPVKKRRSIRLLKDILGLKDFFTENGLVFVTVNAQGDNKKDIEEVLKGVGEDFPVYLDATGELYGNVGIFVVPAVLIANKELKVVNGFGYSHDLVQRVKGEVEIMLGKKTREEVEKELHPKNIEKTTEEKEALRYYNMGIVLAKRGLPEEAIKELNKALKIKPDMGEAWAELGCLNLEVGNKKEAEEALDKAFELVPDSVKASICDAKVRAMSGEVKEAIEDLRGLVLKNARNIELHYTLGVLYEMDNNMKEAAKEFKTAFELLREISTHMGE